MSLIVDINQELIVAMKAHEEAKTSTLRMLLSAVKNRQIELGHELSDEEVQEAVSKSAKQRRESIDAYRKGGREDLVKNEEAELAYLEKYLPEQMSEEEVEKVVAAAIETLGGPGNADTGKVIGEAMKTLKGKADGSVVSRIVREKISG